MVKGGWARKEMPEDVDEVSYSFITNEEVQRITKTMPLCDFTYLQYLLSTSFRYGEMKSENTALTEKATVLFANSNKRFYRDPWLKISELLGVSVDQAKRLTQSRTNFIELVHQQLSSSL